MQNQELKQLKHSTAVYEALAFFVETSGIPLTATNNRFRINAIESVADSVEVGRRSTGSKLSTYDCMELALHLVVGNASKTVLSVYFTDAQDRVSSIHLTRPGDEDAMDEISSITADDNPKSALRTELLSLLKHTHRETLGVDLGGWEEAVNTTINFYLRKKAKHAKTPTKKRVAS